MTALVQTFTTFIDYLRLMTISDIVDIAIMSFIIYKGINILQKTNAAAVAKALLLIVVVMFVSYQLNLNSINFVLSKAMELGLLAVVIIFQPDIRRFLEKLGSNNLIHVFGLGTTPADGLQTTIDETVEAYQEMSKNKVGALMVFQRDIDLSNVISSGTEFQSSVTSELLKNIFFPKAPLHDGAVVVRGDKIAAAGCMLPMSENMNLSKDLGMRHRAGLGISERSDAVVAIVSEETGAISVAIGGNLRRHLSAETLRRVLYNELLSQEKEDDTSDAFRKGTALLRQLFWQGRGSSGESK